MSDQNQFDQYKQKLLHYWGLFLAACGRFWDQVKVYSLKAADFIRRNGRTLGQKLAAFGKAAGQWLRKVWSILCRYAKRLVQILAAWLLMAKEKCDPWIARAKVWLVSVRDRFWKKDAALPAAQETRALPAAEGDAVEADNAEPEEKTEEDTDEAVKTPVEAEQLPVEETAENVPAWKSNPALVKTMAVLGTIGLGIGFVFKWICKLYRFILAAPVLWYAIKFARENMERLPEEVGLDIQSTGEFARMISRQEAVYWPLGITVFCLLLMICSKKPILPWIISIFTLVLPWLIWLLNFYA